MNRRSPLIFSVSPKPGRPARLRASIPAARRASPTVRPPRLNNRSGCSFNTTFKKFRVSAPAILRIPRGVTASGVQNSAVMSSKSSMASGRRTATRSLGMSMICARISGSKGVRAPPPTSRMACGVELFNSMIWEAIACASSVTTGAMPWTSSAGVLLCLMPRMST